MTVRQKTLFTSPTLTSAVVCTLRLAPSSLQSADNTYPTGLNENPSSDEVLAAGSFTGTWDELWSLRDRVVRRLATVDKYEQALQEAKRAEKTYL